MEKDVILLWYLMLKIDAKTKVGLMLKYKSEESIYNNLDRIVQNKSISPAIIKKMKEFNLYDAKEFGKWLDNNKIGFITYGRTNYPERFYSLEIPPYAIYYKGNINLLYEENSISIVGSRRPTIYGANMCSRISSFIAKNDRVVVSGLAQGIDSVAHKAALDVDGKSIGVLGCGIDVVYPAGNRQLYERMSEFGLIVTEFQPHSKPLKFHFPMRNRLISAIGEKLVVVEASKKSGSLITADYTLSLGKDIIAVPGRVGEVNSEGCNKLIRDGAASITEMEDLELFLGINKKKEAKSTTKNDLLKIIDREPLHLDDIIESINVDRKTLFRLLFEMQNTKEIICLPGNFYAKLT
ncbi:MAG: DNA-processing protein DprA [Clostridium sp.]